MTSSNSIFSKTNKICGVCGDRASAYNFGGLSCDSCKIFFRRNGPIFNKFECEFSERCPITKSSRKYCPKCRLKKCFTIGMKLHWLNNRSGKNIQREISLQIETSLASAVQSIQQNNDDLLRALLVMDIQSDDKSVSIEDTQSTNGSNQSTELTTHEWKYINEIQNAMDVFVNETTLPLVGCVQNLSSGYSHFGLYAKWIIKFCKHFSAYRSLSAYDQLNLLRPFYMEITAMRFAFQGFPHEDGIVLIGNETGDQAILFSIDLYPKLSSIFQCGESAKSLKIEMENDQVIRNLLIAQSLFSPRENVTNFEIIRYQYHSYHYLLKRYLRCKYKNMTKAEKKYNTLMHLVSNYYRYMKENFASVFAKFVDFDQVGQVMTELFGPKIFG